MINDKLEDFIELFFIFIELFFIFIELFFL